MFASKDQFFAGVKGYQLTRSLRFRSSASAYLNRTFGTPTDATKFTLSMWVKRGILGTSNGIFQAGNTNYIQFGSQDALQLVLSNVTQLTTTAVFRDPSSWAHLVVSYNNAASPKWNLYWNNSNVGTSSAANTTWNTNAQAHGIAQSVSGGGYFDGYLAEINFIDGQALTPSSFGKTDGTTGAWVPIKYIGTYGNNGFYLPFTDTTIATTASTGNYGIGKDSSGNGNYWICNNISLNEGSYTSYTSGSGTYTVPAGVTSINYLVVAGGGGGAYSGGGGGAGGMLYGAMAVTPGQTISYSVGAGGAGSTASGVAGTSGSSSSFGSITAAGGGGAGSDGNNGVAGGSGGGGGAGSGGFTSGGAGNTPSTTPPQGYSGGGHSTTSSDYSAGGGGGAGAAGGNNSGNTSGSGGAGITWINGTTYAGGGGGGGARSTQGGAGGSGGAGGGGAGTASGNGTAGTANTGGGGGGGANAGGGNTPGNGGAGGSGIVIVGYGGATTYDSMIDVPYCTGQVGGTQPSGNYENLNPIDPANGAWTMTFSNGNCSMSYTTSAGSNNARANGTISASSGKWYCEFQSTSGNPMIGIVKADRTTAYVYNGADGNKYTYSPQQTFSTNAAYGATWTTTDVIGIALDMDGGTVTFYKNNSTQGTAFSSLTGNWTFTIGYQGGTATHAGGFNFGQRPFTYTPPSGYQALCAPNLAAPTIKNGAGYMAATTYTGTGASLSVTNTVGSTSFQPDLVWIKSRSAATNNNLFDAIRGTTNYLISNSTAANASNANTLTAFNSNGFTVGTDASSIGVNVSAATYVGWQWLAGAGTTSSNTSGSITSTVCVNTTSGFSVVTYTGTGANATVGHGLGVAPSMVITKQRTAASTTNWATWHTSIANTNYLLLNTTAASTAGATYWNSTTPTSSVFSIGTASDTNTNTGTYVAYCFTPIAGYSAFGSYTGNGSTDGPFVYCGFRPRFVLLKRSDGINNWQIYDTSINTYNAATNWLYPDVSNAAGTSGVDIDIVSNGFKPRNANAIDNASSGTYIYAAFAENPFNYSNAR